MAKATMMAVAAFGSKVHAFIRLCQADAKAKGKAYRGAHILYSKVGGVSFADLAKACGFADTRAAVAALKEAKQVDTGFAKGGPVLYLPGEAPEGRSGPSEASVKGLLAKL